jgi:hypothetical protein
MKDFEKLVNSIMKECEADGEPVTREEAEEMAKMEMKVKTNIKNYTSTEKVKKPRKPRERKVDNEKLEILKIVAAALESEGHNVQIEKEIALHFGEYSLRLVKHRPKK